MSKKGKEKRENKNKNSIKIESIGGELIDHKLGRVVYETVYDPTMGLGNLIFAVYPLDQGGNAKVVYLPKLIDKNGIAFVPPLSLLESFRSEAFKTASEALSYGSRNELWKEGYGILQDFAYLPKEIRRILAWILLYYNIWNHPTFTTCSYTVIRGLSGKGKNRLVDIFRNCCLRALNLGNCPSVPVLFRAPHRLQPILLLDEVTWNRKNPNYQDYLAIWNSGFQRTGSVPRMEKDTGGKWKIKHFNTFGPKIAIMPGSLPPGPAQSRCLMFTLPSSEKGFKELVKRRREQGLNTIDLSPDFFERTLQFKNKALMWRLKNWDKVKYTEKYADINMASCRLFQALNPLFSVVDSAKINDEIFKYAKKLEATRQGEDIGDLEMAILKVIWRGLTNPIIAGGRLLVGEITSEVKENLGAQGIELNLRITPGTVGKILKHKLLFETLRTNQGCRVLTDIKHFEEHVRSLGVWNEVQACTDDSADGETEKEAEEIDAKEIFSEEKKSGPEEEQ